MANTRKQPDKQFVVTELDRQNLQLTPKMPKIYSEMVGGFKGIFSNIIEDMFLNAILYSPSIIGKTLNWEFKNQKSETFIGYSTTNPIRALWKLAWPSSLNEIFRGWADIIPFQAVNFLFYGITTSLEFLARSASAILMKPLNFAFTGKGSNWGLRILAGVLGLPLWLIGQTGLFVGNTLKHARLVVDSVLNFIPSFFSWGISLFSKKHGKYGEKFPTLIKNCLSSFVKNAPFLLLDVLLITACLVPGGQIAGLLGSSALSGTVGSLGHSLGSFLFSSTDWFIGIGLSNLAGTIAGSAFFGSIMSFTQNVITSIAEIFKKPTNIVEFPIIENTKFAQLKKGKLHEERKILASQIGTSAKVLRNLKKNKKVNEESRKESDLSFSESIVPSNVYEMQNDDAEYEAFGNFSSEDPDDSPVNSGDEEADAIDSPVNSGDEEADPIILDDYCPHKLRV